MAEQTYFNSNGVTVTKSRLITGNKIYPISNISSVKIGGNKPSRVGSIVIVIIFGLAALGSLVAGFNEGNFAPFLFCTAIAGIGFYRIYMNETTYFIALSTAGGEVQALESHDQDFIGNVYHAVNQAIIGTPSENPDTIKCPQCAETINKAAKICRFCHASLQADEDGVRTYVLQ